MQRRHFLTFAVGTTALSACANFDTTLETVASDVGVIAQGFLGIMPAITDLVSRWAGPLDTLAETIPTITNAIANLQAIAEKIRQTVSTVAAQPWVQQVETNLNTILSALASIPSLPPVVEVAVQAASILLSVIEAAVHLIVAPRLAARAAAGHMSPDQARALLRSLAPQH